VNHICTVTEYIKLNDMPFFVECIGGSGSRFLSNPIKIGNGYHVQYAATEEFFDTYRRISQLRIKEVNKDQWYRKLWRRLL